jgi:hypothetical protein
MILRTLLGVAVVVIRIVGVCVCAHSHRKLNAHSPLDSAGDLEEFRTVFPECKFKLKIPRTSSIALLYRIPYKIKRSVLLSLHCL